MFTRFNGNVVPFADDATSTNRTVFGGTTQSDLIDDNLNTNFKKGWEIVGLNDNPTREDFNGMGYTLGALTAYLYEMGISEWNASQNYRANSRITGSDGKIYKSLTGTTGIPNVGNNPITDAVNWAAEGSTDYSALIDKTTPVDADLIAIADSTSSFSLKKLTWANIKATIISSFGVMISTLTAKTTPVDADIFTIGDSAATNASKKLSWANIKATLFSSSVLTGTPTAPTATVGTDTTQIATTAFVKANVPAVVSASETTAGVIELATTAEAQAGTDAVRAVTPLQLFNSLKGSGQLLATNGYQKLHGGLIIQWGTVSLPSAGETTITFPMSFPTSCLVVTANGLRNSNDTSAADIFFKTKATSNALLYNSSNPAQQAMYIAIGY